MLRKSYRIAHISDTHITRHGQFDENIFNMGLEALDTLSPKPDILVHTGDLTDNGILPDYELAVDKLKSMKYKYIIAPGNHDERNYGHSLFKEMFGFLDFEVDEGWAKFVVLNSPQPDRDEGRLGRRRQLYLEEVLKSTRAEKLKIVVFHHHLVPVPYSGREVNVLEDAGDVLDIILQNHVHLVLMGHRHVRHTIKIDETVLVNAGTFSCIRTRGRFLHSFNVIDILSDGTINVLEVDIKTKEERLLKHFKASSS
ncbi:MAG: metallophosphoesterase [Nitrososphaerota archaeon]|nr:metallophosphoesterase [Aigarchaeota archaeon]MDW8076635.1 metallophosphoesterase [Nitrososphaerota archaeon]